MKISKELKNIKCELMINFDLKEIYEPVPDTYIKDKWNEILDWFKLMLAKGNSQKCFQEIYMEIDDLLINDIPHEIIASIEDILTKYSIEIKNKMDSLLDKKGGDFFQEFNSLWSETNKIFNLLRKIMNKYEKLAYGNIQKNNVYEIFLYHLKTALISESGNKNFINHSIFEILEQITLLRNEIISKINDNNEKESNINEIKMDIEEDINTNNNIKYSESAKEFLEKISLIIRFYCETGIYQDYFSKELIKNTEDYYTKKTEELIKSNPIDKYMIYVEEVLEFENYLIVNHLNEISLKPILNKLNIILLNNNKKIIFEKYYSADLTTNNNEAKISLNENYILMKKIYILFKNIKLEEEIKKKFSEYIISTCKLIYSKYSKDYKLFYESIYLLKKNIDKYITESFLGEEKFKSISKESLTKGINQKPSLVCDIFSNYIDNILRFDAEKKSLHEIKNIIYEYMILFKYIGNKDLFENFFIKKLCIRCLFNLNKSEEAQNYLIEQLKKECGPYFVSKSQEMISDVKASQEMSQLFNEKEKSEIDIPINYFILSNYTWPIDKLVSGEINNFDIGKTEKKFFDFYHKKNSGKSLFWHLPFCFGEIEMDLKDSSKSIKIIGNGVHIAILKCFTKNQISLGLKDIIKITKIEKDVIIKHIKKLVNKNILKYENNIYVVNFFVDKDENSDKIMLIDYDEQEEEKGVEESEEKSIEERKFVIDAYIMKILKQKKVMKRSELISTVNEKMPFDEKEEIINKRVDQLINNRYISKDDEDPSLIKYC